MYNMSGQNLNIIQNLCISNNRTAESNNRTNNLRCHNMSRGRDTIAVPQ